MSNHGKYNFNVKNFRLKNIGATYQHLMDVVFTHKIGHNLEVYVDDMIVKTINGCNHADDMKDVMQPIRKYNMHVNPAKCSFGVQAGKFMRFMLTRI